MSVKVLVTGAQGQLGQTIKEKYLDYSDDIQFTFVSKTDLDITNFTAVNSYLNSNNFKYCVNCAAYTNVELAESEPEKAFNINAEAVKHLASSCKVNNTILIHISTDYVFDGEHIEPYLEEDPTNPINVYGKSKLAGEMVIIDTLERYFILRTSWLYSAYGKNFVKTIVEKIEENSDLKITTSQIGAPTSCDELSGFIFHIINHESKDYGTYHFTGNGQTTWYGLSKEIATFFSNYDKNKIVPAEVYKTKAQRPKYSVLNNSKAKHIFPLEANWKDCVRTVVKKVAQTKQNTR